MDQQISNNSTSKSSQKSPQKPPPASNKKLTKGDLLSKQKAKGIKTAPKNGWLKAQKGKDKVRIFLVTFQENLFLKLSLDRMSSWPALMRMTSSPKMITFLMIVIMRVWTLGKLDVTSQVSDAYLKISCSLYILVIVILRQNF